MEKHYMDQPGDIPWKEWAKIRHEINTNYQKYKGKAKIWHRSVGLDDNYYLYFINNFGFDDYQLISRILDTEED